MFSVMSVCQSFCPQGRGVPAYSASALLPPPPYRAPALAPIVQGPGLLCTKLWPRSPIQSPTLAHPHTPGKGLFTRPPRTCSNVFKFVQVEPHCTGNTPPPPRTYSNLFRLDLAVKELSSPRHVQSFSVRSTYIQQMNGWHPAGMLSCLYLCLCVCLSVGQCERTIIIFTVCNEVAAR